MTTEAITKSYKRKFPLAFTLVYLALLTVVEVFISEKPIHPTTVSLIICWGLLIWRNGSRYELGPDNLQLIWPLSKSRAEIPYPKIRSVEKKENAVWKQLLGGVSAVSLKIKYNKFEEVTLHPEEAAELYEELCSRISVRSTD